VVRLFSPYHIRNLGNGGRGGDRLERQNVCIGSPSYFFSMYLLGGSLGPIATMAERLLARRAMLAAGDRHDRILLRVRTAPRDERYSPAAMLVVALFFARTLTAEKDMRLSSAGWLHLPQARRRAISSANQATEPGV
jgi:hypothetical protein